MQICIDIDQFILWVGEGVQGLSYISRLLFIKTGKLQEHDLSQNQILHQFHNYKKLLPMVNNKKVTKWWPPCF